MKFKQSVCIVCYNTVDVFVKCMDHILSTSGLNIEETLFILTNPGSIDGTETVMKENYNNINKLVISMNYDAAVKNNYALARAVNDQFAITRELGIPYAVMHDVDAFMGKGNISNMIADIKDDTLLVCGRPKHVIYTPEFGRIEYFKEGFTAPCEIWTISAINVNLMVKEVGWWSEALMPYNDIDNDINNRIVLNHNFVNNKFNIIVNYSYMYEHVRRSSEKSVNYNPVLRLDKMHHQTIYNMMWGCNPPGHNYEYPLNNIKYSRGVDYNFLEMNDNAIRERIRKYLNGVHYGRM